MELTIEQALQQGITAHKEGKLQEAERLYRTVLQSQPLNPHANHNLGLIAVTVGQAGAALPLFKTALEANSNVEQFWLSYIDALIEEKQFTSARAVIDQAQQQGVVEGKLNALKKQLVPAAHLKQANLGVQNKSRSSSQKHEKLSEQRTRNKKKTKKKLKANNPSLEQLSWLLECYQNGRFDDAERLAVSITNEFPKHQLGWKVLGAVLKRTGRAKDSLTAMQKSVNLAPQDAEAHYNLGVTLQELERLHEAADSYIQAIELKPDHAEVHSNLGATLHTLGKLDEAVDSYKQAIALKPAFARAHCNLGVTLQELGRLDEALVSFNQAISLKPDYVDAYWNLLFTQKTIETAEHCIDKCLEINENHTEAKITKAALRFYRGDRTNFDELMQSGLEQHPAMRTFSWIFGLPDRPELHFNKFCFFDAIIKKSVISKPFYEFGVWRGSSFRYLIKAYKKGYGFDTFTGLPESWNLGGRVEDKGTYTSDGNVPKIKGGEFIVGNFEDTLPIFFSESRPVASVINFDADLYSSTICALQFSKSVMNKDTILIFDQLIMNETWEDDEFKALNEFCAINGYSYEVIAASFTTKQVAVKLLGI